MGSVQSVLPRRMTRWLNKRSIQKATNQFEQYMAEQEQSNIAHIVKRDTYQRQINDVLDSVALYGRQPTADERSLVSMNVQRIKSESRIITAGEMHMKRLIQLCGALAEDNMSGMHTDVLSQMTQKLTAMSRQDIEEREKKKMRTREAMNEVKERNEVNASDALEDIDEGDDVEVDLDVGEDDVFARCMEARAVQKLHVLPAAPQRAVPMRVNSAAPVSAAAGSGSAKLKNGYASLSSPLASHQH